MPARALIMLAAVALAACAGNSLGLSGAGSMRVEVEVYKGPLANDVPIQIGELRTVIEETARTLAVWYKGAQSARKSGPPCRTLDCIAIDEATQAAEDVLAEICRLAEYVASPATYSAAVEQKCSEGGIFRRYRVIDDLLNPSLDLDQKSLAPYQEKIVRRLAQLAGDMKAKGFRVAYHLISYVPRDQLIRTLLANFNLIMFEYSNQIQARVGVLDKQFTALNVLGSGAMPETDPRKRLPVGDYLRDASPTDVVHLFEWFDAGDNRLDTPGQLSLEERVRMAERLFADYYWEKINEVYTSGQGDVSMAFIKNDIGNWDLKSFSNDPAELLDAYRGAADAAISAIVELVGTATPAGGAIKASEQLLDLGNRIASGQTRLQPDLGVLDASALHARTLAKLMTKQQEFAAKEAELVAAQTAAKSAADAAAGSADGPAQAVTTRQTALKETNAALESCRAKVPVDPQTPPCATEAQAQAAAANALEQAEAEKGAADAELAEKKLAAAEADAAVIAVRTAAQQSIREVLDDHMALIAALQEAVAGAAPAAETVLPSLTTPVVASPGVLPSLPVGLPGG